MASLFLMSMHRTEALGDSLKPAYSGDTVMDTGGHVWIQVELFPSPVPQFTLAPAS